VAKLLSVIVIVRPFAFIRFAEYEDTVQAFLTLDGTDFKGRRLNVAFARSSMVTEEYYYKHQEQNNFPVHLVTSDSE